MSLDATLRAAERTAPGSEAHAAALARAGRWVEAWEAYSALSAKALRRLQDAEWHARLDGLAPSSRDPRNPAPSIRDIKSLRREWRCLRDAETACCKQLARGGK